MQLAVTLKAHSSFSSFSEEPETTWGQQPSSERLPGVSCAAPELRECLQQERSLEQIGKGWSREGDENGWRQTRISIREGMATGYEVREQREVKGKGKDGGNEGKWDIVGRGGKGKKK